MLSQLSSKQKTFLKKPYILKGISICVLSLLSVNDIASSSREGNNNKLTLLEVNFLPFKKDESSRTNAEEEAIGLAITNQAEENNNNSNNNNETVEVKPNANIKMFLFFPNYKWSEYTKNITSNNNEEKTLTFEDATFFNNFKALKSFTLSNIDLSEFTIKNLATNMQHIKLKNLSISACNIGDYETLAKIIDNQKTITSLTLQLYVSKDGKTNTTRQIKLLLDQLKHRKMTCLRLAFTFLDAEIAETIKEIIEFSRDSLKDLAIEFQEPYPEDPDLSDHYDESIHYYNKKKESCITIISKALKYASKVQNFTFTMLDHNVKVPITEDIVFDKNGNLISQNTDSKISEDKKDDKKNYVAGNKNKNNEQSTNTNSENPNDDLDEDFANIKFLQQDIQNLMKSIYHMKRIVKLKLCIGKGMVQKLLSASAIKGLSNGCDLYIGKPLAVSLSNLKRLKKLDFSEANLDGVSMESIMDGIKSRTVTKDTNKSTSKIEYQHIDNMDISGCVVTKKTAAIFQEMFNNKSDTEKSSLQNLYLLSMSNCEMDDETFKEIMKNISFAESLQFVDCSSNRVSKPIEALTELDKMKKLETINLRDNSFTNADCFEIIRLYGNKNKLNSLLLDGQRTEEVAIQEVQSANAR